MAVFGQKALFSALIFGTLTTLSTAAFAASAHRCEVAVAGATQQSIDAVKGLTHELTQDHMSHETFVKVSTALAPLLGKTGLERAKVLAAFGESDPFQFPLLLDLGDMEFSVEALSEMKSRESLNRFVTNIAKAGTIEEFKREAGSADPLHESVEASKKWLGDIADSGYRAYPMTRRQMAELARLLTPYLGLSGAERLAVLKEAGVRDPYEFHLFETTPFYYAFTVVEHSVPRREIEKIVEAVAARVQRHIDSGGHSGPMVEVPVKSADEKAAQERAWIATLDAFMAKRSLDGQLKGSELGELSNLLVQDLGLSAQERATFAASLPKDLESFVLNPSDRSGPHILAFQIIQDCYARGLLPELMNTLRAQHQARLGELSK